MLSRRQLRTWQYCSNSKSPTLSHGKPRSFASKTQQMKEVIRKELANHPDVTVLFWRESFLRLIS